MVNIDTLDNMIALVVVILLLSLIVQAVQNLVKKMLRIKSHQIEDSLLDLFDAVLRGQKRVLPANMASRLSAMLPRIFRPSPMVKASQGARDLLEAIKGEMRELGRVDNKGRFTVESLSKSDLMNVLARVAPDTVISQFTTKLQAAMKAIADIEKAIQAVNAASLPGEANALFAKLREATAPLQHHYRILTNQGTVNAGVIVADVLALRDVVFDDSLDLLAKMQKVLAEQKAPALLVQSLSNVAGAIGDARAALDGAFGAFKAKLTEIEGWFDTAMQGFEERYHRGMQSWSFVIGLIVVVWLNANVFTIYKSIATNDVLRTRLIEASAEIQKLGKELDEASDSATLKESKKKLDEVVGRYATFGFAPLDWKDVGSWFDDLRTGPPRHWFSQRAADVRVLFGWLIMALLLTLGAPFWHDALQSLFGVKNLLQRKNEQRNVEQRKGAGNVT